MTQTHTKGPWKYHSITKTIRSVPDNRWLATLNSEANAHIIAAAPDLFDGCNALLGLLTLIEGRDDMPSEITEVLKTNHRVAEARAAIAKAKGRQPC